MSDNEKHSVGEPKNEMCARLTRRTLLLSGSSLLSLGTITGTGAKNHLARLIAGGVSEPSAVPADEDGYRAWLRYDRVTDSARLDSYQNRIECVYVNGDSKTSHIVSAELVAGLSGLLGKKVTATAAIKPKAVVVATKEKALKTGALSADELKALGPDGFIIRQCEIGESQVIAIVANTEIATLYGAFALLRLIQTHQNIDELSVIETPRNLLRILAHSDNRYPAIDRGYSGKSLWHWDELPGKVNERLTDYCRINASIGLNGVIINKVEADPKFIASENLPKVVALADVFRPYGIKTYVSVNFASPIALGGLKTADPLQQEVIDWWHQKADEIYKLIPDFGGFEVKANSEGMLGPQNYGRNHADGANMLADALAPHGGIIMWRAFVYDYADKNVNEDRVKRAYLQFHPLDGQFAHNILIQVKNGPLDFMPREPFHPMFGGMPKTRLIGELQLNQEYIGQATHLVYLGSMWEEFLRSKTYANQGGSLVSDTIDSGTDPGQNGFTATSNLGDDRNWTGHHFGQANWFVYGRLAWDPGQNASAIASDWIKMTWTHEAQVVARIHKIMLTSYETFVSYSMPLGLHHIVGGDHYAPMPEGEGDPRGMFHHAGPDGIGYDRTRAGSDAVDQYHKPLSDQFNSLTECPEKFLLWFHHVPWEYKLNSGRTLWQELCFKYKNGVSQAEQMEKEWAQLAPHIDSRRHKEVAAKLRQQVIDAGKWRDHCLSYFAQFSKMPIS